MYKLFTKLFLAVFFLLFIGFTSVAQNSILVNLGSTTCDAPYTPAFSLIGNPLSANPSLFSLCDMSAQLPSYQNVFIAYNPLNNRIYVVDDRNFDTSKVWLLDMGLPGNITCPTIPLEPTYKLPNYYTAYFEFDNNGNILSLSNYNEAAGQCTLDRLDVTTGHVLSSQLLQFPAGHFPNVFGNGDITILPNGRLFVVLGIYPSQLYEITNFNDPNNTPTVTYLQSMPQNTFGMAYLNGNMEITGTDQNHSCYYYTYDISANTLGPQNKFQVGELPIDNSSITPAIGTTKQLAHATLVNNNTADLTYEVYLQNMGNVILNNINVTDDLGAVYGAGNVSNVSVSFEPGGNDAGLTLNSAYNGTTVTAILDPNQELPNNTATANTYFLKLLINCRITNLKTDTIYYNSAISSALIGSNFTAAPVSDSSNNGPQTVIDPNNNGNAGDAGENVPTPFIFNNLLPVHFVSVTVSSNDNASVIKWTVAAPTTDAKKFEVEYSTNGTNWKTLTEVNVTNQYQSNYQYTQTAIAAGNAYYRILEVDNNGYITYSRVVSLNSTGNNYYIVSPNPANNTLQINASYGIIGNSLATLYDATGRRLTETVIANNITNINTTQFPDGTYLLRIKHGDNITAQKVLIVH